jgi:hypothetical protein
LVLFDFVPSGKNEQPSEVKEENCSDIGRLLQSLNAALFFGLIEQENENKKIKEKIIFFKERPLHLKVHIFNTKKDVAKSIGCFTIN